MTVPLTSNTPHTAARNNQFSDRSSHAERWLAPCFLARSREPFHILRLRGRRHRNRKDRCDHQEVKTATTSSTSYDSCFQMPPTASTEIVVTAAMP